MISFKDFLGEALTDAQTKQVNKWTTKSRDKTISFSDKAMGGKDRISIPLQSHAVGAHPDVANHLKQHGYEIKDYQSGLATDTHGRDVKIGKALAKTKAPQSIINTFANDSSRQNKSHDNLHVVMSRNPHDVAAMSTGRSWESCMNMDSGAFRKHLPHDIKQGTHVAYLTDKNDHTAENPVGRIALKPYVSEDKSHTVLRPESRTYGTGNDAFHNTVRSWSEHHFPLKEKTAYKMHDDLYDDTTHAAAITNHRTNYTHSPLMIKNTKETLDHFAKSHDIDHVLAVANHGGQEHLDQLKNHPSHYVRAAVQERHSSEDQSKFINDPHEFVRAGVAKHGTDEHRKQLLTDPHHLVRMEIARHDETHHDTLKDDKNADVRFEVARKSTNRFVLNRLANNMAEIPRVKTAAKSGLDYLKHVEAAKAKNKPLPDRSAY